MFVVCNAINLAEFIRVIYCPRLSCSAFAVYVRYVQIIAELFAVCFLYVRVTELADIRHTMGTLRVLDKYLLFGSSGKHFIGDVLQIRSLATIIVKLYFAVLYAYALICLVLFGAILFSMYTCQCK